MPSRPQLAHAKIGRCRARTQLTFCELRTDLSFVLTKSICPRNWRDKEARRNGVRCSRSVVVMKETTHAVSKLLIFFLEDPVCKSCFRVHNNISKAYWKRDLLYDLES